MNIFYFSEICFCYVNSVIPEYSPVNNIHFTDLKIWSHPVTPPDDDDDDDEEDKHPLTLLLLSVNTLPPPRPRGICSVVGPPLTHTYDVVR